MSKIVFLIAFILNLLLTAFLGWSVLQTQLISPQIVIIAAAVLALIPMLLFALQKEKKGRKSKGGFRVAAIVILAFLCLVEGAVCFYVRKYNSGIGKVTEVTTQYTQVEFYVKDDNRAQTIEYAVESQYRIGTLAGIDEEALEQVRAKMEEKYGRKLVVQSYDTLMDLVRAMDEDEIEGVLISSAYLDLMNTMPGYENFGTKLRVLYSGSVQTEIVLPTETEKRTEPEGDTPSEPEEPRKDPDLWTDCFCAYISGIDTYGEVTARSRSDVNILAIVNTATKTVLLVSTPRDYYVPFHFGPANGDCDKLTHAGIYGIDRSMMALGDYYGLPIHYYMRVNFTGFIEVIDLLGGVDVESDADFGTGTTYFHEGMNHLTGTQALKFVRNRYAFLEGDRARGRHQMAVIKGVINGLSTSRILTNYGELMDQMAGCFQTNASRKMVGELVQLTLDRSKGDWNVITYSVDGWGNTDYTPAQGAHAYVMVPFPETRDYALELVDAVIAGETLTQEQVQENAPKF